MDAIRVAVTRGDAVEAVHAVDVVVVRGGAVTDRAGDPHVVACWHSSAKPAQAVPLVADAPELTGEELAIACASHEARHEQLAAVRALLGRSGAGEDDLACGPEQGSRLRHNCSGKHAGMLLVCRRRGWPATGYQRPEHPLQVEIRALVGRLTDLPAPATAVDGCGVPTFVVPLERMAIAFERLAEDETAGAARALAAMRAQPLLIGGPGAVDTRLMLAVPGAVAKRGAEGLLCGALPGGGAFALKCRDGAERPLAVAAGVLLGVDALREEMVPNSRGEPVGSVAATS
jgi:L-asparaginase II